MCFWVEAQNQNREIGQIATEYGEVPRSGWSGRNGILRGALIVVVRLGRFSRYVSAAEPDERLVIDRQDCPGPLSVGCWREKSAMGLRGARPLGHDAWPRFLLPN